MRIGSRFWLVSGVDVDCSKTPPAAATPAPHRLRSRVGSRRMPCEPLDAPEDQSKQALRQVALGMLESLPAVNPAPKADSTRRSPCVKRPCSFHFLNAGSLPSKRCPRKAML